MGELFTTPDNEGEHAVCESEGGCKCLPTRLSLISRLDIPQYSVARGIYTVCDILVIGLV